MGEAGSEAAVVAEVDAVLGAADGEADCSAGAPAADTESVLDVHAVTPPSPMTAETISAKGIFPDRRESACMRVAPSALK
ncbi:hypothetical protein GCM10009818_18890 [Nakamurella flavida]